MMFVSDDERLINEWDFTHNIEENFDPALLSTGSNKKVWWKCEKGHSWKAQISSRNRGRGCPYCSGNKILKGFNDLATTHPAFSEEWNYEENAKIGYFIDQIGAGSGAKVWWKCPNGHSYDMVIQKRTSRGFNCPYCSGHRFKSGYNDLQTLYPDVAAEWHPSKNGIINPSDIPAKTHNKYWWVCPLGHEYLAAVNDRAIGHTNCPICNKRKQTSFPEQALYYYIKKIYPNAVNGYRDIFENTMELDIFIPEIKYGIEYDGKAFHATEEQYKREYKKFLLCRKKGIKLLRLKEGRCNFEKVAYADFTFYIENPKNEEELTAKFQMVIDQIDPESNMFFRKNFFHYSSDVKVNFNRDRAEILSNYLTDIPNSLQKEYPEIAKMWNYEKNGELTPSMFMSHSNTLVWWKCCKCGHEWQSQINSMTRDGRIGCAICAKAKRGKTQTKNALKERSLLKKCPPEILKEFDCNKNELTPDEITIGSARPIWWKCKTCGFEWYASPQSRIKIHTGCPHCSGRVAMTGVDDLKTLHPEALLDWDYERNSIQPDHILPGSGKKVFCTCHYCGFKWSAAVREKLKRKRCPNCKSLFILL